MQHGIASKIAKLFINSKLTILLMVMFTAIGVYSSFLIPREEEPQIDVPIADIFISYPGASPETVESKVVQPLEKIISNITGIEYVYSTSMNEQAMLIVQFYVGEDIERSVVKLYNEIMKHMDQMPPGVSLPLIKTRAIDDVPMLALTLWSENYDDFQLKKIADEVKNEIEKVNDVAITKTIGGRAHQIRIELDKQKIAESNLDFLTIAQQIQASNSQIASGSYIANNQQYTIKTGDFIQSKKDLDQLIVAVRNGKPVYLHQIATILDGPEIPKNYVSFGYGAASKEQTKYNSEYPAVTISIGKRKGADAMLISEEILEKVDHLKKNLIPSDVIVTETRNYGETASHKVSELLLHLFGSIIAVTIVVMLAMGWRGGLVVFLSVPITFAMTMFSYYMLDYTLNRITLFALVFVTGIVVDDSIIIAENMHRHFKMKRLPFKQAALYAINEVGNPTILATFTVIASVLPMAFVSGLMGPYMSPMPIGASLAMIISLFVALTITPYLGYHILREKETQNKKAAKGLETTFIYKLYNRFEKPLIENSKKRWAFLGFTSVLLLASFSLFYFKVVAVKMLPFDNKNEFQVVIDMPEGTTLEQTNGVAREIAHYLSQQELIENYQSFVGTSAPITFNGLVRHYDLRHGPNVADIQVNFVDKSERDLQSHDIVKQYRAAIQEIGNRYSANVKLVEVPPGPPVLSTIVAEIYGPDYEKQITIGKQLQSILSTTKDIVDVDDMVTTDEEELSFTVQKEKASIFGVSTQQIVSTMKMAMEEQAVSSFYSPTSNEPIGIILSLPQAEKSSVDALKQIPVVSALGQSIPLGELITTSTNKRPKPIYRKNQKRVVYVLADMAGELESPVYGILNVSDRLSEIEMPEGHVLQEAFNEQPKYEDQYTVKWDGEWQITYEVFRDLGAAFSIAVFVIYLLIVGWFQNFKAPLVMLVSIPLSLVGIIVGHWWLGAFFTATSMIGMIALAGIMVRNSVLLIDFIELRLADGVPLKKAVIEAGAVRTTPILLTAGTVVIGAFVILFDPIFQGLAISLMGGTITATILTLLVVPLMYYMTEKHKHPNK